MTLNDRISKVIEYSGLTSSEFADEIEAQRSSISHITSGRNRPSLDFLIKVKEKYPEIQWNWLILGEGEMLEKVDNSKKSVLPLPDLFAMIDDDNFGKTEREDKIQKEIQRESIVADQNKEVKEINDSQALEEKKESKTIQISENQNNTIKRIVIFYENGKFESFEP